MVCIVGTHDCPTTNICVNQGGNTVACVPGCQTDDDCQGAPNGAHYCNPSLGDNGTCVQCTLANNSQCTTSPKTFCDTSTGVCRFHGSGESCTTDANCGYEPNGDSFDCDALGAKCINVVRCGASGTYTYQIIDSVCSQTPNGAGSLPDQCPADSAGSDCPSGYVNEWASTEANSSQETEVTYQQMCVAPAYACTRCD